MIRIIEKNLKRKSSDLEEEDEVEEVKDDKVEIVKKRFKTLSWNIDGLDSSNLESRTNGVIQVIVKYIIFSVYSYSSGSGIPVN